MKGRHDLETSIRGVIRFREREARGENVEGVFGSVGQ